MTLVLSASMSGKFIFMTSDTRRVQPTYKQYDLAAGIAEIDQSVPYVICDGRDIKTHKLNDRILAGAGGCAELAIHLTDILKREVKADHDLSDCKDILQAAIQEERTGPNRHEFSGFLDITEGVTVILNGFYRDGTCGLITFTGGEGAEVEETKSPPNHFQYSLIAPAVEYLRRTNEVFHIPQLLDEKLYEGSPEEVGKRIFDSMLNHLVMVHGVTSYNHPIEISPDFEIHVITQDQGEFAYSSKEYDLSETHSAYDKIKKQIVSETIA